MIHLNNECSYCNNKTLVAHLIIGNRDYELDKIICDNCNKEININFNLTLNNSIFESINNILSDAKEKKILPKNIELIHECLPYCCDGIHACISNIKDIKKDISCDNCNHFNISDVYLFKKENKKTTLNYKELIENKEYKNPDSTCGIIGIEYASGFPRDIQKTLMTTTRNKDILIFKINEYSVGNDDHKLINSETIEYNCLTQKFSKKMKGLTTKTVKKTIERILSYNKNKEEELFPLNDNHYELYPICLNEKDCLDFDSTLKKCEQQKIIKDIKYCCVVKEKFNDVKN